MCRKSGARRKQYVPGAYVLRHTPITKGSQDKLAVLYHASLDALRRGHGSHEIWQNLADAINVSLCMAENHNVLPTYVADIRKAQDALISCRARAHRLKRWAFNGDEIKIIYRAVAIHDEQVAFATKKQLSAALNEVNRRIEIGAIA